MKLKKSDGNIIYASISKGRNIVFSFLEQSTGQQTKAEMEKLDDYEIMEATLQELRLLKEGEFKIKGL